MAKKCLQLRGTFDVVKDYFFPKNCFNCYAEGNWLCNSCKDSLFFLENNFCPFCGKIEDFFCLCNKCKEKTGIKKSFSIFRYSDPLVRKLIKNLKYRYIKDILKDLEPVIRKFLFKYDALIDKDDNETVIPIPLYWLKEKERGFNQAQEIGHLIAKTLNLKLAPDILKKKNSFKNQADVPHIKRYQNVRDTFSLIKKVPRNIILVDDVLTTGSTVCEAVRVLREGGAQNIQVITLAKG